MNLLTRADNFFSGSMRGARALASAQAAGAVGHDPQWTGCVAGPSVAVGRAGAISVRRVSSRSAEQLYESELTPAR